MKVLILGSGGREHALAWRLAADPDVSGLISAPGNPGMRALGGCFPLDIGNPADALELAAREGVDLTVVGPETALDRGVADVFRAAGRAIVGPSGRAAALESSKAFSKDFMERHNVPTARFRVCDDVASALAAVSSSEFGFPVVVKADGLAAGKGVVIAADRQEAEAAIRSIMVDQRFGTAGTRVVIEECLEGPEVSLFFLCDGERALPLASAQDHKRIWDDDRGPNTGGMGAFAPSPLMAPDKVDQVIRQVVRPVIEGMQREADPYRGFLYVSLMLTADGAKVIEFNVRFGDPEAQVVMPSLEGRFAAALMASATGSLEDLSLRESSDRFVGVVLASAGYPATADPGRSIRGIADAAALPGVLIFQAGTRDQDGQIVTAGGRVLTVVGRGSDFESATATAYDAASRIQFEGMQFRRDIGRKAIV